MHVQDALSLGLSPMLMWKRFCSWYACLQTAPFFVLVLLGRLIGVDGHSDLCTLFCSWYCYLCRLIGICMKKFWYPNVSKI
jgi:hypothetical protein